MVKTVSTGLMLHSTAGQYPFAGNAVLAPYHPTSVEMYLPVAPGIEVSVEPGDVLGWDDDSEATVYNTKGRLSASPRKGTWIDCYL